MAMKCWSSQALQADRATRISVRVVPTAARRNVAATDVTPLICHPERSAAKSKYLRFAS
jgi:hypothetical protein